MDIKRRKFQGVLNILSFNRHFYVVGIMVWLLFILATILLNLPTIWSCRITGTFIYGLLMPLIISAYIYDFSGYYDFNWLKTIELTDLKPTNIVNINAGFDETSFILESKFPEAKLQVFDFYNAKQHTEPAIVRARRVSLVYPNTKQIDATKIPLNDQSGGFIFLLS